jgi:uncharacterized protein
VDFLSLCGKGGNPVVIPRVVWQARAAATLCAKSESMAYYALIYHLVNDYVERRAPLRTSHLALAKEAHARGELLLAGAFADPVDTALLIFHAGDKTVAESFAMNDPYVLNGLVKNWEVRAWNVVIGNIEKTV